ncbi:unnamed protein product [Didymodactylos carnosus]|uniref:Uncharacterized protein n=1 Tax=Didymodactylos carnosus TaxID=1234261 RepID=A0A815AAE0_9BILA|nr:unnamed protein product [Didymodactylos carnosus]CAF1325570.1 unnamed protein product [Didymodactylos carnosus]CAF4026290.1 unnamed protein product [Didymodactylos carnosus]CAF4136567.1 unnamed protein product [Didymodactylos carnosus]
MKLIKGQLALVLSRMGQIETQLSSLDNHDQDQVYNEFSRNYQQPSSSYANKVTQALASQSPPPQTTDIQNVTTSLIPLIASASPSAKLSQTSRNFATTITTPASRGIINKYTNVKTDFNRSLIIYQKNNNQLIKYSPQQLKKKII